MSISIMSLHYLVNYKYSKLESIAVRTMADYAGMDKGSC